MNYQELLIMLKNLKIFLFFFFFTVLTTFVFVKIIGHKKKHI